MLNTHALTDNVIVKDNHGLRYNGERIKVAKSAGQLIDSLLALDEKSGSKCEYKRLVCEKTKAPLLRITTKRGYQELWAYIDDVRNVQTTGESE